MRGRAAMMAWRRAVRYCTRNLPRTLLLTAVIALAGATAVVNLTVGNALAAQRRALIARTDAKIVATIADTGEGRGFTADEIGALAGLDNVSRVNRSVAADVSIDGASPVAGAASQTGHGDGADGADGAGLGGEAGDGGGTDTGAGNVGNADDADGGADGRTFAFGVQAYDDWEADGPFAGGQLHLEDGALPRSDDEIVVNGYLARLNGWQVGSTVTLGTAGGCDGSSDLPGAADTAGDCGDGTAKDADGGQPITATIVGLAVSGDESQQSDATPAAARLENQLYASAALAERLDTPICDTLSLYVTDPGAMDDTERRVRAVLGDQADLSVSNTLYEQVMQPLERIAALTGLTSAITLAAALAVSGLLLCLWQRARRREFAVLMSLGHGKPAIVAQVMLEAGLLLAAACLVALPGGVALTSLALPSLLRQADTPSTGDAGGSGNDGTPALAAGAVQDSAGASDAGGVSRTGDATVFGIDLPIGLAPADATLIVGIGGMALAIIVMLSLMPVMRRPLRDLLADAEE